MLKAMPVWGQGPYGKSTHFLLHFAVNIFKELWPQSHTAYKISSKWNMGFNKHKTIALGGKKT